MTRAGEDGRPRRTLLLLALVGLALAFAGTVTALNLTLYSASGFVTGYLHALGRGDAQGALTTPGVTLPDGADTTLIAGGAIAAPRDIRIADVVESGDGTRTVSTEYTLAGDQGATAFVIEPRPALFGLFARWAFVESPVATLEVTAVGTDDYEVGTVQVTDAAAPASYPVLVPAAYTVDHESRLVTANDVEVAVTAAATTVTATLQTAASEEFVGLIQDELDSFLAEDCATQQVLQPTGCPFGQTFGDRIQGLPTWGIDEFPQVTLQPGATAGEWVMPATAGAARLTVEVVSIFDGSVSTFDEAVPFEVGYAVSVADDGGIAITATPAGQ